MCGCSQELPAQQCLSSTLGTSLAREMPHQGVGFRKAGSPLAQGGGCPQSPQIHLFKIDFYFSSPQERLLLCCQCSGSSLAWLSFMGHWAGRALQHWDVAAGWELQQPGGRASGQDKAKLPPWQETPLPTCSGTPGNVLPSGTEQQEQQVWLWHVAAVEIEVYTAFIFFQQEPLLMHIQSLYTKVCSSGKKPQKTGKNLFDPKSPKGELLFV